MNFLFTKVISYNEVITVFGMRGSGKSVLTRKLASLYNRKLVFDRLREWHSTDGVLFSSLAQFKFLIREHFVKPNFTLIYQPNMGMSEEALHEEVEQILRIFYQMQFETARANPSAEIESAIVIEEVQFYCGPTSISPWLFEIIVTGRHAKIALISNSQRPASVHKALVSQSHHVFCGQLFEARDHQYLRESFGENAYLVKNLPLYSFYWFRPGQTPVVILNN